MPKPLPVLRPQFILMVGDEGVTFVPCSVPGINEIFFAAHNDRNAAARIVSLLSKRRKIPVIMFADNLAQDFRQETLPRLSPFDRPKLVKRRVAQAFPQAKLTSVFNLGAAHILMIGLPDGPLFEWMERLKQFSPRLCLVPIECAGMLTRLLPDASLPGQNGWAMMLSRQQSGGFRQIVTHKGDFVFTRLTPPLPEQASGSEIAAAVERDIRASLGYLGRFGLTDSRNLRVILLMPEVIHEELEKIAAPIHSLTLLSPHKMAHHLKLPFTPHTNDPYSDLVYAGWLAQKRKPLLRLTLPGIKIERRHASIRKWGMRAACLALLISGSLAALRCGDIALSLVQIERGNAHLGITRADLLSNESTMAAIAGPIGRLREALGRKHIFSEPALWPWPALTALEQGMGADARLVKFDWQSDAKPDEEVLRAKLRLTENVADRETVVARFQSIARNIAQAMPDYTIDLTHYPFPALPQESVTNAAPSEMMAELTVKRRTP